MDEGTKIGFQLVEEFITRLGFPIAVAMFFMVKDFLRERKQSKKITEVLNNIATIHEQDARVSEQTMQLIQNMQTQIIQINTFVHVLVSNRGG